ncbi:hypothetical protein CLV35_3004 [Motilibacter peucedani]|uniref:PknH-like protein n=1 Tax=Motilibacter peucedani TaxID=598650 RepID=A0A420XNB2_9ACTN|nr:hypothetical protein [Motilibacter peucedani]RKS72755.1 hypothetical protein CLV35_3004 [Motilibacter peucedani]
MRLVRPFALVSTAVGVAAVTGLLAAPADAAPAPAPKVTTAKVRASLLDATDLEKGWKHVSAPHGAGFGCLFRGPKSVGMVSHAHTDWQYGKEAAYLSESVQSYATPAQARTDLTQSVAAVATCRSVVEDGTRWTVRRVPISRRGDSAALFRVTGTVVDGKDRIPVTTYLAAAVYGRQEIAVITAVAAQDSPELHAGAVEVLDGALAKVKALLPR